METKEHLNRTIARLHNPTERNISLHLEPQGHQFTLPPKTKVEVVAFDSPEGVLDIDFEADLITVWAWVGSMLDIYCNGTKMMTDQGYIP